MKIERIRAIEVLDSRGNPTIETHVYTYDGYSGYSIVPSGASTGNHEAFELRDLNARFHGNGVLKAVENVNTIINAALKSIDVSKQTQIDNILCNLDGTTNKHKLGANAILSCSIACLRAAANANNVELYQYLGGTSADLLPLPMMNIINGGVHASNNLDIQEFMIVPVGAINFSEGVRMCTEVYHTLKKILITDNRDISVGDEGGFASTFKDYNEAIEYILDAVQLSGYNAGKDIKIALDAAASNWYNENMYTMPKSQKSFTPNELVAFWEQVVNKYPIISIEDPAAEDDWDTWNKLFDKVKIQIVGDDLFATNKKRLLYGIENKAANAILIKPNQIGTVTETIESIKLAKSAGMGTIISHRSGDTEDPFIADLAVGLSAGQIKTGAPCRSERNSKYNRLLYIEDLINNSNAPSN